MCEGILVIRALRVGYFALDQLFTIPVAVKILLLALPAGSAARLATVVRRCFHRVLMHQNGHMQFSNAVVKKSDITHLASYLP